MAASVELEVPYPLSDCFQHSETICERECCGIDAISDDPELVAQWGRTVGCQAVRQALAQIQVLIVQIEDCSHNIVSWFLNACTYGEDGEGGREELLTFLKAFETALGDRPMNEVLTRAEMEAQFDGEWVIVADPEIDENYEVRRGRVLYHGVDQETLLCCYGSLGLQETAYLHFGGGPQRIWLNDWLTMGVACEHGSA